MRINMYEISNFLFQLFVGELFALLCAWMFPQKRRKLLVFILVSGVVINGIVVINKPISPTITQISFPSLENIQPTSKNYLESPEITNSTFTVANEETSTIDKPKENSSIPRISKFTACKGPCNGNNSTRIFPEGTTIVYLEWDYENITFGLDYERSWTMDEEGWVKYQCKWSGNDNGHDKVTLTEPDGLHSGIWEMTIKVNQKIILREKIIVEGNVTFWTPVGTLHQCYGKVDR